MFLQVLYFNIVIKVCKYKSCNYAVTLIAVFMTALSEYLDCFNAVQDER